MEIAGKIGLIVIGAVVAFGSGLLSFWLQRRWIARDAFHLVIQEQIAKFHIITKASDPSKPSLTYQTEDAFLQESIPILIAAARRVRRQIGEDSKRSLDAALEDYRAYQAKYRGVTGRCLNAIEEAPDFTDTINTKLEKIDECVTDNPVA